MNPTLQARNSIGSDGTLLLYGVIGDWWDGLDALSIVQELERMSSGDIKVRIHSSGGYITEGLAIYNALKASGRRVVVHVDGLAASMASVVAMAGDEVHMPSNALMMIHNPWTSATGDAELMRQTADTLDTMKASLLDIYASKTGISTDELTAMLSAETWMRGARAKELGFVDVVTGEIKAAARLDVDGFMNAPRAELEPLFNAYDAAAAAQSGDDPVHIANPKNAPQPATPPAGGDPAAPVAAAPVVDVQAAALAAVTAERTRAREIREIFAAVNLPDKDAQALIDGGNTVEDARIKALGAVAARDAISVPGTHLRQEFNNAPQRAAMLNALLHRADPGRNALDERGRDFRGYSLMDLARATLEAGGHSVRGRSPMEIAAMAMASTSDFPLLLADVANKSLRDAYQAAPQTFRAWCRKTTLSDFKKVNRLQLSAAGKFEKVLESGEFKRGKLSEDAQSYKLDSYGEIIAITRQTLINDDLDALSRIPAMMGAQAANMESDVVYALLLNNVKLSDGKALFHADHKNLGTAGALAEGTLNEMRKLLRMQTAGGSAQVLNLLGKYLLVPAALELQAEKLLSSVLSTKTADVNVFANKLELLVEPRLDAVSETAYYQLCAPTVIDTFEYAYLTGDEGVYIESRAGFEVDGIELKARLDFGAGVIDHRGLVRNAGA